MLELLEDANEPLTATEIAEQLGISNRTALDKLNELNEREPTVMRKEVGASAVIWYIRPGVVHEQAFETFAEQLTEECESQIERIILYGSVARGDAREHSDVDVLIVTEDETAREIVTERASSMAFDLMLETGVSFSLNYKTTDEMEEQRDLSYIQSVLNEGQVYG